MSSTGNLLGGVVIAVLLMMRQIRPRPVRKDAPVILNVVLLAFGVSSLVSGLRSVTDRHPLSVTTEALLVLNLIAAVGFGLLRAHTVRLFLDPDGTAIRTGGALTALTWLASLAAHLLVDKAINASTGGGSLGLSTISLYLGITLIVQNSRLRVRARHMAIALGPTIP